MIHPKLGEIVFDRRGRVAGKVRSVLPEYGRVCIKDETASVSWWANVTLRSDGYFWIA